MDIRDIFGAKDGQPDNEDFWALTEQILRLDTTVEDMGGMENFDLDKSFNKEISPFFDMETFEYVVAERMKQIFDAMNEDTGGMAMPGPLLLLLQGVFMAAYHEGVIVAANVITDRKNREIESLKEQK